MASRHSQVLTKQTLQAFSKYHYINKEQPKNYNGYSYKFEILNLTIGWFFE